MYTNAPLFLYKIQRQNYRQFHIIIQAGGNMVSSVLQMFQPNSTDSSMAILLQRNLLQSKLSIEYLGECNTKNQARTQKRTNHQDKTRNASVHNCLPAFL